MPLALSARSEAGANLVALAELLAADFTARAAEHDREATYPHESIDALREAGYFAAPIPVEHGGLGVDSVHDVIVASSRLARGDASVAIGVNMHLVAVLSIVRRWRMATAAGNARRAAAFAASMEQIARDGVVMAAAISEPGQDVTRPATVAVRTPSGWRISGRKIFCTMSPAATVLYTAVRFAGEDGSERYGYAQIPASTPGVRIHDDWDAMGMRASGSHSVTFEDVEVPASALRGGFEVGRSVGYIERNLPSGLFHASASLGIAEMAMTTAVARVRNVDGARARMLVAEATVDLSAARAALSRAASLIDEHHAAHPADDGSEEELVAIFAEGQAAKAFINAAAERVVGRALELAGGGGYLNGSPLARAYRDVRAGSFMHPLGSNRAYEYVGAIALGERPELH